MLPGDIDAFGKWDAQNGTNRCCRPYGVCLRQTTCTSQYSCMSYSPNAVESLLHEHDSVQAELQALFIRAVGVGCDIEGDAKEHILHGAGRRMKLLRRCLANVFVRFPPSTTRPLASDDLDEVQISLHAFVINLYGLFENFAWAFIFRHDLEDKIGNRRGVGLFLESTQKYLPPVLKAYLTSKTMVTWHQDYLKNYRDALAHRIPLYIPPSVFSPDEGERFSALEQEKLVCLRKGNFDRLELIRIEQAALGSPCFMFLHSFEGEGSPKPVQLHSQMLCDAKTVLEFGALYFSNWHERA